MSKNLLFIIGTRPELIKVFPIINYLKKINYSNFKVVSTGQHKELLEPYLKAFDIVPDYSLDIIKKGQSLSSLTIRAIEAIDRLLEEITEKSTIDVIFAQGDTTTVMASSMVAFYRGISFAHIEAGLRSHDLQNPFPEEYNRKVAGLVTKYHFAPTEIAKNNLVVENTDENNIHVVGNTVIDTLQYFISSGILSSYNFTNPQLEKTVLNNNAVLITCHRRENHSSLDNLINAIEQLSRENPDKIFIWPVHPNPMVKERVLTSLLSNCSNVLLTEPIEYLDILKILTHATKVISDSGGIQEEAPTFEVPVLILRERTERPEAVDAGFSKLVGMDKDEIVQSFYEFNPNLKDIINPYGDGSSSGKIIDIVLNK